MSPSQKGKGLGDTGDEWRVPGRRQVWRVPAVVRHSSAERPVCFLPPSPPFLHRSLLNRVISGTGRCGWAMPGAGHLRWGRGDVALPQACWEPRTALRDTMSRNLMQAAAHVPPPHHIQAIKFSSSALKLSKVKMFKLFQKTKKLE